MSRTSKALKRLGVAGVVAATIGAGVPAFFATAALAAGPTTHLAIQPSTQSGAAGTCILYTVTPQDASNGVPTDTAGQTIQLSATTSNAPTQQVSFCNPTPPFANSGTASSGPFPPFTTAQAPATSTATPTAGSAAGAQTFGVRSTAPGTVNIRAWVDQPGGTTGQFDAGEPSGTATATVTAGGTNTDDVSSGGNAAQDAVKTITEIPQSSSANPVAAGTGSGSRQFVTVQLKNASGDPVSGVTVSATFGSGSANGAQAATTTTAAQPAATFTCVGGASTTTGGVTSPPSGAGTAATGSQGGSVSNNIGEATCYYTATRAGTDTVIVFVNQSAGNTSGPDAGEPQLTVTRTTLGAPNTNTAEARNIDLTPNGPTNTQSGGTRTFTATVTDAAGKPVQGVNVQFTKSGAGTFAGASQTPTSATNAQGQVTVTIQSATGETGQAVVTATITTGGTQCGNAAGTPTGTTTAGNCSDSEVTNFTTASPSPTASPTATPTNPAGGKGTLTTSTPDIQPNVQGVLNASGLTANAVYELMCYSRPSTTYFVARSATVSAGSSTLEFRILPGTNTRCYVRPQGNDSLASNSVVINVHTTLSLSAVRTGVRQYVFQGRNLPRRAGQLITLYRIANGQEIRTSNLTTDASGIYRVTRTFTGTGTFQFRVRTSQTLTNAPGASNIITVTVH
jgi:adhesin/invasin